MEIRLVKSFGACRTFVRIDLEGKWISPYHATVAKESLAILIFVLLGDGV